MKKIILSVLMLAGLAFNAQAQRFCIIDMEYILNKMPEYTNAQKTIDQLAETWKKEIDTECQAVETAYNKFQAEQVLMTDQMKKQKIEEIENLELRAKQAQQARFGPEGDLFKKRQELIKPVQDKIYDKIKLYAEEKSYEAIFDKSSAGISVLYIGDRLDKSEDILKYLEK